MNIRDHGVPDSDNNKRAVCNYCQKNVSNFSRLKAHLGGVGVDVRHCVRVTPDVKEYFRNELLGKKEKMDRDLEMIEPANRGVNKRRRVRSLREDKVEYPARGVSPTKAQRTDVDSDSFTRMVHCLLGMEKTEISVPPCNNLRGSCLEAELEQIKLRTNEIRASWKATGCSVVVDGWRDKDGRDLLNVLVDCPHGAVYLKSLDISAANGDIDALLLIFNQIIEEVGENHVVQIISNALSPCMSIVGKLFMENHPTIFWTISASHCLEHMIWEIGTMGSNKRILEKAITLSEFIYSRTKDIKLMRTETSSRDVVRSNKIRSTVPFLSLDKIVSKKENIKKSCDGSRVGGTRIANLVSDTSFWAGADEVLNATIPLVRTLHLIHKSAEPQLGFIYESMDRAKEKIKKKFDNKKARYMPYWDAIDEMWNNILHSPLHSAAFYLNPRFRYSTNFCRDPEVNSDLNTCICAMVEEKKPERLVFRQIYLYSTGYGAFGGKEAREQSSSISPVDWWSRFGKECPELQTLAIHILSQTCVGASRYHLNRSLAERLFKEERNQSEQQQAEDITYCLYNKQLEEFMKSQSNHKCKVDEMDGGVVDKALEDFFVDDDDEPNWMELTPEFGASTSGYGTEVGDSLEKIIADDEQNRVEFIRDFGASARECGAGEGTSGYA